MQYPHEDVSRTGANTRGRKTHFKPEEKSLGAVEGHVYKFSDTDEALKATKGFMTVLKAERTANLYKVIGNAVIGDASMATEKEDTTRLWHMHLEHMSEIGVRALHSKGVLSGIKHCKLNLYKFYIMGRQLRVAFTISVHKIKDLLDLVRTDVWRLLPITSIGGACY